MKDFVKKSKAFISFENPLKVSVINRQFDDTHYFKSQYGTQWIIVSYRH
jgi:hypothetical protein